ncbi:ATP-binding cassette domain-containing protein [Tissierella carlieri]|uniref:ABC transporter ATP-binding protein n=1 Tax=Tissierella carlieri TaxID=689904 RepID=UPI001C10DFF4|nr:ATP-binding cassette domain-containing protein [Tissierella carlieri]MBU5311844.1 ATP-binding cassette domain-containing protein [Tissierella carlieri]MDU5082113.1 ATP-binding cassette domain-containing protein [Bacillota bacterium]
MYQVKNIIKNYNDLKVLEDISIDFPKNKTTCILGPSGCGKTTLLNIISGIIKEYSGEIIGFEDDISFVFQEDRLIPWNNVSSNIEFVLKNKMNKEKIETTMERYLKLVNLEEYRYYYPKDLSGGMRQKISILRAFAYPSNLLIMDEPFKSLDINSKQVLIDFFKELRIMENRTCIIVTHDIEEALTLGDKIVILTEKPTRVKKIMELNGSQENRIKLREIIEKELMM